MIIKKIKKLKNDIFRTYRLERYQHATGDYYFRNEPQRLQRLWFRVAIDSFSLLFLKRKEKIKWKN